MMKITNDKLQITKFLIKKGEVVVVNKLWRIEKPGEELDIKYKIVVEEGGELELRGRVIVEKTALDAKAFLEMRVLQLGEKSKVVVVPDLEIKTDEVKASHAVSVARVDEEQIFYMMSRGLSRDEAVKLLVEAFLN